MIAKLDGMYHWVSAACMTTSVGMVVAGNTALEPALQSVGAALSVAYWAACSAFAVATAGFAYIALMSAQEQVRAVEARVARGTSPASSRSRGACLGSFASGAHDV